MDQITNQKYDLNFKASNLNSWLVELINLYGSNNIMDQPMHVNVNVLLERGFEHLDDIRQLKTSSHLLKHLLDKHEREDWDEIDIRMEIKNFSRTAFERQIMEAC